MKNYIQKGENITLPAPAAVLSGEIVIVGELHGVAAGNAALGDDCDVVTEGVFELPKVAADEFAIGDPVYFDVALKLVTTNSGENAKIGIAVTAAPLASYTVNVKLA
jgi:predicted RecA/RadA family phage recombinase